MQVRRFRFLSVLVLAASLFAAVPAQAGNLSCAVLPQLFNLYFRFHYVNHQMSDEIRQHTVDQFIKAIDPSKTLLLDAEVEKLRKELVGIFKTMDEGNCKPIEDTHNLLVKRAEENEAMAKDIL